MIRDVLSALQSGQLAQVGLLAFVFAFVLITIRAFAMRPPERSQAKNLPLEDDQPVVNSLGTDYAQ